MKKGALFVHGQRPARKRRRVTVSRKPVLLARDDMEHIIANARDLYESMPRYEPALADAIAAALFNQLTSPLREHPVLLSRICGISDATLWQWRVGRTDFNVDLLSKYSDSFARALGLPLKLAEEAANLMSGIPWRGKKSGPQLLQYVVQHDLDARSLLHLARRQERMNISTFARRTGISKDLLSRMSSPPKYDSDHPGKRGDVQVTLVAQRFGLTLPDEIAEFRLLATRGMTTPLVSQRELAEGFHHKSAKQPRHLFLLRFLTLLRERHGLPSRGSLADAIWEQTFPPDAKDSVSMDILAFNHRLTNVTKPPMEGCVRLPEEWAEALASFAFPSARELKLRLALARYLKNNGDSRSKVKRPKPSDVRN